ncbi:hypothetical protein [Crystallibacter degradans]|uniref:hypothetical protein n=1 Tax=Crystallibacter degradans TaxID=2726743 RepID=UPI001473D69A|nr:hypothetical protein [Arthrobacter sp. SF27]NMR31876.1 hypothetical protein [Arthrobacter sp. SF27]
MISATAARAVRSSAGMLLTILGLAAVAVGILGMHVMPAGHGSAVQGVVVAHVTGMEPLEETTAPPSASAHLPGAAAVPDIEGTSVGALEAAPPAMSVAEGGNELSTAASCLLALTLLGTAGLLLPSVLGLSAAPALFACLPVPHGIFPVIRPPSLVQLSISRT